MIPNNEQEILPRSYKDNYEIVLSVNGVSKKFCRNLKRSLLYGIQDIASEVFGLREKNDILRSKEFWALKDVNFQLRRGEALGLVGKNGSGKSTLLRMIAGLIKPDTGFVEVHGRVAPLIALGAGFNPILTGRENIYANMSILGLSKKEIDERFDQVVDFAEIGDAIDAPVQSYSSGMAARLGFASAIHTEPEILLIDEVLAVGDSRFRGKCFQKLHDLRQKGTSFILVSHDAHLILTVCESAVYLKQGEFVGYCDTPTIISQYERDLFLNGLETTSQSISLLKNRESFGLNIYSLFFKNDKGEIIYSPVTGEQTYLCIRCKADEKIDNVGITFVIKGLGEGGETVLIFNSMKDKNPISLLPGEYEIQLQMPYLGLRIGVYIMDVYAKTNRLYHLDAVESFRFTVEGIEDSMSRCLFYQPRTWNVINHRNDVNV
ncbi:MAG: ABC transporter ATP-binding protein [Fischerella sp. CENA71]|nr:ABC transporter ATP-binding protein [Fischerella sp. CENA71]